MAFACSRSHTSLVDNQVVTMADRKIQHVGIKRRHFGRSGFIDQGQLFNLGAKNFFGEVGQHMKQRARNFICVDLIACQEQLVRALDGGRVSFVVAEKIIEPCQTIGKVIIGVSARTVDHLQVFQRQRRQYDAGQQVLIVAQCQDLRVIAVGIDVRRIVLE